MHAIFIQAIGLLGAAAFIISYQVKSNKMLYLWQLIGSLLFCIQFFLMGTLSGSLSLFVNLIRNSLVIKYNDWKWVRSKVLCLLLCLIYLAIMLFTWAGPISMLPFAASAVTTIGFWQNNAKYIRMANLFCACPCWLVFDIIVLSIGGIINESVAAISIIISVARFGWKALGDPNSDFQNK